MYGTFHNNSNKYILGKQSHRDSIPEFLTNKEEIIRFLEELQKSSEEWRVMKLIILGNGQIGKTTFVQFIKQITNLVFFIYIYLCSVFDIKK
jgi:hypothetical protein